MPNDGIMSYFAKIGLDASDFLNGINQAQGGLLQFYRDVSLSLGATIFIFDKFLAYGQKFIELSNQAAQYVSTIDKLAVTTGMSTEELQRWTNVARYADSDITTLATSVNKMQMNLAAQGAAGDEARQMLDDMGVSYRNIDGSLKSSAELFPAIIQGLKGLESSSDRVTAANTIFGRSYQSLAGYMKMSKSEMEAYFSEAGILTDEQAENAREYEQATKDLNASITNLSNTAGSELAPSFAEFTDLLNDLADNEGIMSFFSALNDFLTLTARGFHILGAELQTTDQFLSGDMTGAMKTQEDLGRWVGQKTRDDAMKAAGYRTDGLGNVVLEESSPAGHKLSSTGTETGGAGGGSSKLVEDTTDRIKNQTLSLEDLKYAVDQGNISWQEYNDILGGLEISKLEDQKKAIPDIVKLIKNQIISVDELENAYNLGNISAQEYADILNGLNTNKIEDQIQAVLDLKGAQKELNDINKDYARDLQILDPRDVQGFINLNIQHKYDVEDQEEKIAKIQTEISTNSAPIDDLLAKYDGSEINLKVTADTTAAEAQLDAITKAQGEIPAAEPPIRNIPAKYESPKISPEVMPDITPMESEVSTTAIDDFFSKYDGSEINLTVTVDTAQAEAQIQSMIYNPLDLTPGSGTPGPAADIIPIPSPFISHLPTETGTRQQIDNLHLPEVTLPSQRTETPIAASGPSPGNITITGPITVNGDKSFENMLQDQRVRAGVRLR